MAQNVTFDLHDTVVPAGTLKIQVTVDLTSYPVLTGSGVATYALTGDVQCTGAAFLTELKVGAVLFINGFISGNPTTYSGIILTITDDENCTIAVTSPAPGFPIIDASLKVIVFPSDNFLIVMDEQVEKVDVKMGMYEYDEFTLEFAEDYSWYVAGFWYNLFRLTAGYPVTFFVRMTESGTDSFVTYGNVNLTSVEFNELALDEPNIGNANSKIRTCKLSIISGLDLLKNVLTANILSDIIALGDSYTGQLSDPLDPSVTITIVNFNMIISCIIQNAFNQSYNVNDLQVRNSDIKFINSNSDERTIKDLFYNTTDLRPFGYATPDTYFNSDNSPYWGDLYPTTFDLLNNICFSHGYVPRYYYGQDDGTYIGDGSDRHHIELLTRGNSESAVSMVGELIESTNMVYSPYMINGVRSTVRTDPTASDYFYNSSKTPNNQVAKEEYGQAPDYLSFELEIITDFNKSGGFATMLIDPTAFADPLVYFSGTLLYVQYYNYETETFETVSSGNSETTIAAARYYFYKFKGQATYNRTYSDVRSTVGGVTSQANTRCLRRHQITDEFGTRTFYAIEVRKSFIKNTATLVWFQE